LAEKPRTVNRLRAAAIVASVSRFHPHVSQALRTELVDALEHDLDTTSHQGGDHEQRLRALEEGLRALEEQLQVVLETCVAISQYLRVPKVVE